MNLLILLSGVILVNNQPNKELFVSITKMQVVEQYKIIPEEIVQNQLVAKKTKTKKALKNKKTVQKKKKASQKKKKVKIAKKKVVKSKNKKKTTYKKTNRVRYNVGEIQAYAHQLVREYGWTEEDYQVLVLLWYRESSWNPNAVNKKSGACGIPQANPCSKASKGTDYRTNWRTQVRWGLNYIKNRYGTPREAWKHSQDIGWY